VGNGFVSKLNFNSSPLRTSSPLPSIVAMSTPPSVPVSIVLVRCPFRPPRSCCRRCKLLSGEELCRCMLRSVLPLFISPLLFDRSMVKVRGPPLLNILAFLPLLTTRIADLSRASRWIPGFQIPCRICSRYSQHGVTVL
jgi:hypothetical protein